jgi:hypothetical protein
MPGPEAPGKQAVTRLELFFSIAISKVTLMNYAAFTSDSLTMMYEATRGALVADDAAEAQGHEPRFKVRDTAEWKKRAADLEAEMLKRGMMFTVIDWHEGQEPLPFGR